MNYYNEIDPYAAQWLRNLIVAGLIAPGEVDERSILDVHPSDLRKYTQCHFFAGEGVWSGSLRFAGWSDDRSVWTGSCPCQPFSAAGKRTGVADERHLWPAFFHLIQECRPYIVFGEQVASKDGEAWIDIVQADLESSDFTVGAVVTPSAGFGAPHIRHRAFFVADALFPGWPERRPLTGRGSVAGGGSAFVLADTNSNRLQGRTDSIRRKGTSDLRRRSSDTSCSGGMADSDGRNASPEREQRGGEQRQFPEDGDSIELADSSSERHDGRRTIEEGNGRNEAWLESKRLCDANREPMPGPTNGHWKYVDWLLCRDGRWRPVEPGTFPLAHGAPSRVGRLRAHGNAINLIQAAEFIGAYLDVIGR